MKQSFKTTLVTAVVILIVILIAAALYSSDRMAPESLPPATNQNIDLPQTTFDTEKTVLGTSLQFLYPSRGFYGLGAEVVESREDRSVTIQPTAAYVAEKGGEYVTLTLSATRRENGATLEEVVDAIDPNSVDGQYAKMNGEYRTVNGLEMFVYKVTEDATAWTALTVTGNDVVTIRMAYKRSEGRESEAAYENNGQLFEDVLAHVQIAE